MKERTRIQKPLLGFGWAGYAASVVLLALIVPIAVGVDLRYELLKLIRAAFGDQAMMWFVTRLPFALFTISDPTISVTTGVAVLIAARITPYRISLVNQAFVLLLCFAWVFISVAYFRTPWVERVGSYFFETPQFNLYLSGYNILSIIGTVVASALIVWITRSWIVAIGFLLAASAQFVEATWSLKSMAGTLPERMILFTLFEGGAYSVFSLAFDMFIFGPLILWAVRERRKSFPPHACQSCGYSLVGIPFESPCPECGQKPAVATT